MPVKSKVDRHLDICIEMNKLYEKKNHDYGDSFHQTFTEEGFAMARIRLADKFNRFKTLSKGAEVLVGDESIRDTLIDLANYSIMTVLEMDDLARENREYDTAKNPDETTLDIHGDVVDDEAASASNALPALDIFISMSGVSGNIITKVGYHDRNVLEKARNYVVTLTEHRPAYKNGKLMISHIDSRGTNSYFFNIIEHPDMFTPDNAEENNHVQKVISNLGHGTWEDVAKVAYNANDVVNPELALNVQSSIIGDGTKISVFVYHDEMALVNKARNLVLIKTVGMPSVIVGALNKNSDGYYFNIQIGYGTFIEDDSQTIQQLLEDFHKGNWDPSSEALSAEVSLNG